MQSHRVIASSLVARSARAGLEQFPVVPTFSGVDGRFFTTTHTFFFTTKDPGVDSPCSN